MDKPQKTNETLKSWSKKRFESLKNVYYKGWRASHQSLSTYINETRGNFDENPNHGEMIDHKTILDGHATQSAERVANNLNSFITSKSRPWFRLSIDVRYLNVPGVRLWIDEVQKTMYEVMEQSNIYDVFQSAYEELVQFGTACFLLLQDYDDVVRGRSFTAGEYYLATDGRGRVNTFAREDWMTVGELASEFGYESLSSSSKALYDNNQKESWVKYCHLIEPNKDRVEGFEDEQNMPFRSLYWESSCEDNEFLAKRGLKMFRVIAPRWKTTTTSQIYGYGPGWYALGDVKELQKRKLDSLLMEEKLHNPSVQKDSNVEGHVALLPGGITNVSSSTPNSGVRANYQVPDALNSIQEKINNTKAQIDRFFFLDVFQTISQLDKSNITALEIAKRDQERVGLTGPILNKLDEEMLSQTVEIFFSDMTEAGMFPEPPEEIQGVPLKVQYTSVLAQAQRALGIESIERFIGFAGQYTPNSYRIIDADEALREVGELAGVPAKIVKTEEAVRQEDEIAAQQAQMAQQAEMANSAADTAKKLADSDTEGNNALTQLSKAFAR